MSLSTEGNAFVLPASFAQRRLWFIEQAEDTAGAYNVAFGLRLSGTLDLQALRDAFTLMEARHETLRTTFVVDRGSLAQVVRDPAPFVLPLEALDGGAEPPETALERRFAAESRRSFDLAAGPLIRAVVYRLSPSEHALTITMHHSIVDAWSIDILTRELGEAYSSLTRGTAPALEPPAIQYADYAVWQAEELSGPRLEKELDYWRTQLRAPLPALELPLDRPRPPMQTYHGARHRIDLPADLAESLRRLARDANATLFMTLLATYQLFLARHTGQDDLVTGTPITGRHNPETAGVVGFFLNMLAIRTRFDGRPGFRELLGQVRQSVLGAYGAQDLPFEKLVESLRVPRDASRHPLFQTVFVMHEKREAVPRFGDLAVERLATPDGNTAKFDFMLSISDTGSTLRADFEYNTDLFDASSVARMAERYVALVRSLVAAPDRPVASLAMLPDAEKQIIESWTGSTSPYPRDATIPDLFEAQVQLTPHAPAVGSAGHGYTYHELDAHANRLAHHLRSAGVDHGAPVGLLLTRSADMVPALLGILKAGGVYVPLDPNYPSARLAAMITGAGVRTVLTTAELAGRLPAGGAGAPSTTVRMDADRAEIARRPATAPLRAGRATDAAYILFTSGSTGVPKGVTVPHRAVVRLVRGTDFVPAKAFARVLGYAPLSFDASTFELWGPLLNGGTVVIFPAPMPSLAELAAFIEREHITTVWLTAALFHQLVESQIDRLAGVQYLLAGGDVLSPAHVRKVLARLPGCRMINGYGPTENTTFTCCHAITSVAEGRSIPIGRPIANTSVRLLDARLAPVPIGVAGELYAGGDGLAIGYRNEPALTADRFLPDPFRPREGGRLYRTGDRARWLPDGTIEFLGRMDDQAKIRGYRIEPSEISACLARHPAVADAAAVVQEGPGSVKTLVGYYVLRPALRATDDELREYLKGLLPPFMVPAALLALPALPLTANGKLDRRALPIPETVPGEELEEVSLPRTTLEVALQGLWEELLQRSPIGVHDDFFELGGHSLLAARMVDELQKNTGLTLPISALFQGATIEQIARYLLEHAASPVAHSVIEVQRGAPGRRPFFMVHGDMTGGGFYCKEIARHTGPEQPIYAIPPLTRAGDRALLTIEAMAAASVAAIRRTQPEGPYLLGGYCIGGLVAYEIAQQLQALGQRVELLLVVDSIPAFSNPRWIRGVLWRIAGLSTGGEQERLERFAYLMRRVRETNRLAVPRRLAAAAGLAAHAVGRRLRRTVSPDADRNGGADNGSPGTPIGALMNHQRRAMMSYRARPFKGRLDLVWTTGDGREFSGDPEAEWRRLATDVHSLEVPSTHVEVVRSHLPALVAAALARVFAKPS